jgi:tetratricopeptide (TPR) repeat protein
MPYKPLLFAVLFFVGGFFTKLAAQHSPYQIREALSVGNPAKAVHLCNQALNKHPGMEVRCETLLLLGEALEKTGQQENAVKTWRRLTEGTEIPNTWKTRALNAQARLWLKNKNTRDKALEAYRTSIRISPAGESAPEAILEAARLFRAQGELSDALKQLEAWKPQFAKHPLADAAVRERAEIEKILKARQVKPKHSESQRSLDAAEKSRAAGKHTDAVRYYQETLRHPNLDEKEIVAAHLGLFSSFNALNNPPRALETLQSLANNKKISEQARLKTHFTLGQFLLATGASPQKAEASLRLYISANLPEQDLIPAKKCLVMALARQGKFAEAKTILISLAPQDSEENTFDEHPLIRLNALLSSKPVPEEDVLGAAPHASAAIRFADAFFAMLEWEQAARAYRAAVPSVSSTEEQAYCILQEARCLARGDDKDRQKALSSYERFLKDPALRRTKWAVPALYRAAVFCVGPLNNTKKGIAFFNEVVRAAPQSSDAEDALFHIAMIHFLDGKKAEAQKAFEELLKKFPRTKYKEIIKTKYLPELKKTAKPSNKKK